MTLLDLHTHNPQSKYRHILNCGTIPHARQACSIGLHPWDIGDDWEAQLLQIAENANKPTVVAIGECGFDPLATISDKALQREIFYRHIMISEDCGKPLIIHSVRSIDRLLEAHKSSRHKQAWIVHGFRGKPQQAAQLVRNGIYLSFGAKFNADSAKQTPTERLFIETDESTDDLQATYRRIADIKNISPEQLLLQINNNALRCNIML